ncbi:nitric-oxide synthase, partial [Desmophyllum pertusum]
NVKLHVKPSYEYQDDPWKHHSFKKNDSDNSARKKAFVQGSSQEVNIGRSAHFNTLLTWDSRLPRDERTCREKMGNMGTPESVHRHRNLSSVSHDRVGRKTAIVTLSGDQVNAFISNISRAVKFSAKLFSKALAKRQKAVILYATANWKIRALCQDAWRLFSSMRFDPK